MGELDPGFGIETLAVQFSRDLLKSDSKIMRSNTGPSGFRGPGQSQSWSFDAAGGRLLSMTNGFGETTSLQYDTLGRVSRKTFASGQFEEHTYDSRNRLTGVVLRSSTGAVLRSQSWVYDASSKVTHHTVDGVTTAYTYDGAGQLLSESRPGYLATYTYDGNGNRLTRTVNGLTEVYAYDAGDKLLSVSVGGVVQRSFGYDAAGRTTSVTSSAGTTTLTYDFEGRATSIVGPGVSQFNVFNGLDTRVGSTTNSVARTFLRDGAYVTDPVLSDGAAVYTPGISERRGATTTFLHSGLKNADAQSGVSQSLTAARHYDAFGNLLGASGSWQGPFGYAGAFGYQEDTTGLMLLGHRLYDPSTGRFLTRDPIKDGRNWYVYCESDPVNGTDPWGLAKIYVAWRPVALVGNHVYLIIVDENTGDTWTIGGGPEYRRIRPGDLIDHSGPAGRGNYEGVRPGVIPPGAVLIRDDDLPGLYWYNKGNNIGGEIEAKGFPYNPFTTNSNAFLYTVLKRAGLLDEWIGSGYSGDVTSNAWTAFGRAEWAPGWGTVLPR